MVMVMILLARVVLFVMAESALIAASDFIVVALGSPLATPALVGHCLLSLVVVAGSELWISPAESLLGPPERSLVIIFIVVIQITALVLFAVVRGRGRVGEATRMQS